MRIFWSLEISSIWDQWHSDEVSLLKLLDQSWPIQLIISSQTFHFMGFIETQHMRIFWSLGISSICDWWRSDAVSLLTVGSTNNIEWWPWLYKNRGNKTQQMRIFWSLEILSIWDQRHSDTVSRLTVGSTNNIKWCPWRCKNRANRPNWWKSGRPFLSLHLATLWVLWLKF